MKLGYKGRLALLLAGQVCALVLVGLLIYRPGVAGIAEIESTLAELSEKQEELCTLATSRPDPEGAIARARARIARLENRMPPESRVSWISAQIAETMQAHVIDLRAATDWAEGGARPPVAALKRLEKEVTVRCPARNLQAFVEALNRLPFLVVVEDLEVRRSPERGAVSATMKLATFVLRLHTPPGGPTGENKP